EQRDSLWRLPAVRSLFALNALGFLNYSLLLSALPAHAAAVGYGLTAAGAVTTVFLVAPVLGQVTVPGRVRRFGWGRGLLAGRLVMVLPSPRYLLAEVVRWLTVVSVARGFGSPALT